MSFHRERYLPRGGPDGGDGGRGGDLYLVARTNVTTLDALKGKRHFRAGKGMPGGPAKCYGKDGADLHVELPVGTMVRDMPRGHVLVELLQPDEPLLFLKGGKGGRGNFSYRSATRQTPRFAQPGQGAQVRKVQLELKLMADVGLIGLPNAGKSTLLRTISHARPKVGAYAFTTLAPRIGMVEHDYETITVADLPGLLEGAHEGKGLGDRFLRHVERNRVLVHLVDASAGNLERLIEDHQTVRGELEAYGARVSEKPYLLVLSKVDACRVPPPVAEFAAAVGHPVLTLSSLQGEGISPLIEAMFRAIGKLFPSG